MNLVGKIFTVLILVMSLVFMSMAVTLYMTHRNWREAVVAEEAKPGRNLEVGLRKQLQNAQEEGVRLTEQKANIEKELAAEKKAHTHEVTKLETENKDLTQQRDEALKKSTDLDKRLREAVATVKATEDTLANMRKEIDDLRVEVRTAREARDKAFTEAVAQTDKLHQEVVAHSNLKTRTEKLIEELNRCKDALRVANINVNDPSRGVKNVIGKVLGVSGADLIEISLGKDDGVIKGQQFDVFDPTAGNKYIARGEVTALDVDKAVCRITTRLAPLKPGFVVKDVVSR